MYWLYCCEYNLIRNCLIANIGMNANQQGSKIFFACLYALFSLPSLLAVHPSLSLSLPLSSSFHLYLNFSSLFTSSVYFHTCPSETHTQSGLGTSFNQPLSLSLSLSSVPGFIDKVSLFS